MTRSHAFLFVLGICLVFLLATTPLPAAQFVRGDVDGNGELQITDPVGILGHLFLGSPSTLGCMDAADTNDSGEVDMTDAIYALNFLFLGGSTPAAPFTECGEDPTPDGLDCASYPSCVSADREPPVFHGQMCTEMACSEEFTMEIGSPIDIVSVDSCNSCTPIRVEDNVGVAGVHLELLEPGGGEAAVAFNVSIDVEPSAALIDLAADAVHVLVRDGTSGTTLLYTIPFPEDEMLLPHTLAPGAYVRRILAVDASGNEAFYDLPVTVTEGKPFEEVQGEAERDFSPDVEEAELRELVEGNAAFALDLYRAARREGRNIFYSPYSISAALAMTYAGAREETARQMASTLHFTLPEERLHPAFNALELALESRGEGFEDEEGDGFKLHVANSMWGQKDYTFLPDFLDVLARNYGAGLRLLDFIGQAEASRIAINDWVSDQTEGRIQDLLPPGIITTLTRLVLTNAIYFKASWKVPFQEELTRDGDFHLLDGGQVTVPMMRQDSQFGYTRGPDYQAVELPYLGENLSMVILLPDSGSFEGFEEALDGGRLNSIVAGLARTRIDLRLPKFQFEFELPLNATLMQLGMRDAFTPGVADLSGMDGTLAFYIHAVLHKAFISVNERGTEAAAATAVVIGPTSVPPSVIVDRPFIFLIRDIPTGAVLFLGRVVNPAS